MDWQGFPLKELLEELPKGLGVAVTLLLIFLGYRKGSVGTPPPKDVEIAGAIVDNSAIFRLASSIEQHNHLMAQNLEQTRHVIEAFNRHAEEIRDLAREIRESVTAILRHRR